MQIPRRKIDGREMYICKKSAIVIKHLPQQTPMFEATQAVCEPVPNSVKRHSNVDTRCWLDIEIHRSQKAEGVQHSPIRVCKKGVICPVHLGYLH